MNTYLVLAKVIDPELFAQYIKGHIPSLAKFGGKVVFRSIDNVPVYGTQIWDAIVLQEWPDAESFDRWWRSDEYRPWAEIRDKAATVSIIKCDNFGAKVQ
jgi:uncharacterized protein (DUF1330 family)